MVRGVDSVLGDGTDGYGDFGRSLKNPSFKVDDYLRFHDPISVDDRNQNLNSKNTLEPERSFPKINDRPNYRYQDSTYSTGNTVKSKNSKHGEPQIFEQVNDLEPVLRDIESILDNYNKDASNKTVSNPQLPNFKNLLGLVNFGESSNPQGQGFSSDLPLDPISKMLDFENSEIKSMSEYSQNYQKYTSNSTNKASTLGNKNSTDDKNPFTDVI